MRMLLGLWLTQAITAALVVLALRHGSDWTSLGLYAGLAACVGAMAAFGLAALSDRDRRIAEARLQREHDRFRQDLRVAVARQRSVAAEKLSAAEARVRDARTGRLKAGAIAGGAAGIGLTLVLSQVIALGLGMIAFALGAAAGWGLRGWQARRALPRAALVPMAGPVKGSVTPERPAGGRLAGLGRLLPGRKARAVR